MIVAGAIGAVLMSWAMDRTPPVVLKSVEVAEIGVSPGETLHVRYSVHRNRDCAFKADRWLFDSAGNRFTLPDVEQEGSPGPMGGDTYSVPIQVPFGMREGVASYRIVGSYRCNYLHRWWPIPERPPDVKFLVYDSNLPGGLR